MLKSWLLLLALFAGSILNSAIGQSITNYTFLASTGTFTPLTGGTSVPVILDDDVSSGPIPIGFTFHFMGVPYTQVTANSNGYITFTPTPTTNTANMRGNSFTSTVVDHPILAALWDDLMGDNSTGTPSASYLTTGSPGSRVFTMEFLNWAPYSGSVIDPTLSFQIQLEEATGTINYIYRSEAGTTTFAGASIGISNSSTAFASLDGTSATPAVSNATSTNNITTKPATGQVYSFIPISTGVPASAGGPITFSNVGLTTTTLSWTDNSTSETLFRVYRSTDNVNFTYAGLVSSTTSTATGATYSFAQTGLLPGTLYYYQVVAANEASAASPLTGSQATLSASFCGVRVVGPSASADHATIADAINYVLTNGLTCGSVIELEPAYVSSVETFPIVVTAIPGSSASNTLTIRPMLGATNLSIVSSAASAFTLDGVTNLIIDGRAGGTGSAIDLTIQNTATTGVAVTFINGASNNTIQYSNIRGVTTSTTSGVVLFGTSTATNGNSNNTLSNNRIYDGATTPTHLVYSAGTAGKANSNNTVSSNEIYNFFNPASTSTGINLQANNTGWTITGNNLYQTSPRTATSGVTHSAILITSSVGSGFTITNNNIGGSTVNAGGTAWTYPATIATRFMGINVTSASATGLSTIDGNTVANIALTSSSATTTPPGILSGISVSSGNWNIGTVAPNTIGSLSGNGSITLTATTTGTSIFGISSSSSGNVTIANNAIGSFNLTNAASNTIRANFTGINASAGTVIITGNTIGGTSSNSINNQSGNTATTSGHSTTGINFSGTTGTITNNLIQNLSYTAGGTRATVVGINISSGAITADNNTITGLSNSSANTLTGASSAIIGLSMTSTTADAIISETDITNLNSSAASAAVSAIGIYYSGSSTGSNIISRNHVLGIRLASTSTTAVITGIHAAGGVSTYRNNIVNLGIDAAGSPLSGANIINGIIKSTTANNNFFYNTIRIQGSGVGSGAANTYAFIRTATGTDELRNNIISNTRTNATTGGTHYGISLNAATSFLALKNNYWVTGPVFGNLTTDYASLAAWQTGTSLDATSIAVDPNFISSTDSHISTSTASPLESAATPITGITTDFDGDVRPGPVGSVNGGGTAPDIGADEFDGIPVPMDMGATALVSPLTTGCYSATETVTIEVKNFSGSTIDFSVNPLTVTASVTGPNPVTFTPVVLSTGTIAAGATQNVIVSSSYNMTATGTYVFTATAAVSGDGNAANNSLAPVTVVVSGGTASVSSANICSGQSTTLSLAGYNGNIQWQSSPDGLAWTNETGTGNTSASYVVSPTDTIMYRALVCGTLTSNVLTVNSTFVDAPTANNVTRCGAGPVALTATGTGTIYWYTSATSTNPISSGSTYNTTASANATYYASASSGAIYNVGLADNTAGGAQQTSTAYNIFTVTSPAILEGVYVYPGAAGNAVLELRNSANALLYTATLPVTTGDINQKTWFPLGWALPVATDLRLARANSGVSMFRSDAGVTYPYTIPGVLSITNSSAGNTYYYFAYDWRVVTGCESARTPVTVTVNPADAITASASSATICSGNSTTLTASSTNAGYSYEWSPSTGLSSTTGASVTASPNASITYTVTGTDAAGCQSIATVAIDVNQSPVITATATPAAICPGGTSQLNVVDNTPAVVTIGTGTITNTSTSYPTPYGNYWWGARHQFLVTAAELTAAGLVAGDINALGFDVANVNLSPALSGFEIKMGTTANTAATTFQTGLTTVYTNAAYQAVTGWNMHTFTTPFNWDGVSNVLVEVCFNNGSYEENASVYQTATSYASTVHYRADASGVCSNTSVTGTFNQRPNMRFERLINNTYSWSPTASISSATIANPVATPASTTTYTVSVTAMNGCVSTAVTEVSVNPVTVSVGSTTDVACFGGSDGSATASSVGGTTWTYSWNTVPAQTTPTATNLTAGTYSVVSTNDFGCSDTAIAVINEPTLLTATTNTTNVSCFGGNDGSASVLASGGTPVYTYTWSPAGGTLSTALGLAAGTYTVTVTDANGCSTTATATILDGAVVTVTVSGNDTICTGASTTLTATGADVYSWNTGETTAVITASPTTTSTYTVTGTDVNGCVGSATYEVTVQAQPVAAFTYNTVTGMDFDFVGTGGDTYAWDFGDMTSGTGANVSHSYTAAGSYDVVLTATNGCGSDTSMQTIIVSGLTAHNASKVNVYPNPSKGVFTLEMTGNEVNRITILDVDGRIVVDKTVSPSSVMKTTIDLSTHAKGVYTLKISGEKVENFRLILN